MLSLNTKTVFALGNCLSFISIVSAQSNGNIAPGADAVPEGGWEHGVDWSKVFPGAKAKIASYVSTPQADIGTSLKAESPAAKSPEQTQSVVNQATGSSASCPDGCQMTIKFSDDSLDVPFIVAKNGSPKTGQTKGTCICMSGGSVRVNIGSTDIYSHSSLIEGSAAGLDLSSFFDVSYNEGYNYPIVCWTDEGSMSGSNIDLYKKGSCPGGQTKMGESCVNPGFEALAKGGDNCWQCTLPDPFFGPAAGAAYTYPRDDSLCSSQGGAAGTPMGNGGKLTCCVGPSCRSNTQSKGGETSGGRCDSGCQPCEGHGQCTSCTNASKRDLAALFAPAGPTARKHKRHSHDHKKQH